MVHQIPSENIGSTRGILPVVIPVAFLIILTGVVRMISMTVSPTGSTTPVVTRMGTGVGYNSSEKTFARYAVVLGKLSDARLKPLNSADDDAILGELAALVKEPITMDGNTFRETSMSHFSPQTLLLSVTQRIAKAAHSSAKKGDYQTAQRYVDAMYGIGDHVLSVPSPSLAVLESAHHLLGFAVRLQGEVLPKGDIQEPSARYREWALTTLWKKRISPKIEQSEFTTKLKDDKVLAANLMREYRDGWSRIRANEV